MTYSVKSKVIPTSSMLNQLAHLGHFHQFRSVPVGYTDEPFAAKSRTRCKKVHSEVKVQRHSGDRTGPLAGLRCESKPWRWQAGIAHYEFIDMVSYGGNQETTKMSYDWWDFLRRLVMELAVWCARKSARSFDWFKLRFEGGQRTGSPCGTHFGWICPKIGTLGLKSPPRVRWFPER